MEFIKRSSIKSPKISLILLDWSVRESFHLLYYLSKQNVARDLFEVILIEYYSTVSEAAKQFMNQIDTWVLLKMPTSSYYHKHLMYNVGIALSRGEICVISDSDAMVKETFIQTILKEFEKNPSIILHLDQFRNIQRHFYPFNYPDFDEVIGRGCINNASGKTIGTTETEDLLHKRNYGACMCAPREAMIAIGGADEYLDYVGHICGPYDMTFRLMNKGLKEVWHKSEFTYHTWHPGQAGEDNYLGPHDGRHMSTTALEVLFTGRTMPLWENKYIQALREKTPTPALDQLINPDFFHLIDKNNLKMLSQNRMVGNQELYNAKVATNYMGFKIIKDKDHYVGVSIDKKIIKRAESLEEMKNSIKNFYSVHQTYRKVLINYLHLTKNTTNLTRHVLMLFAKIPFKFFLNIFNVINDASNSLTKSLKRKFTYFHGIEKYSANHMNSLIDGLFFLSTKYDKEYLQKNCLILIHESEKIRFVEMLFKLQLLKKIPLKTLSTEQLATDFLSTLEPDKTMIISCSLFLNFYDRFNKAAINKNLIII